MRLSQSLRKNVFETAPGKVVNKFKIHKRRDTLFFEDILAGYLKHCESKGYGNDVEDMCFQWALLAAQQTFPGIMRALPPMIFLNKIQTRVWTNMGYMDELKFTLEDKDRIRVDTCKESITRTVGANRAIIGVYRGLLQIIFKREIKCVRKSQSKKKSSYIFGIGKPAKSVPARSRSEYIRLNETEDSQGPALKRAISGGILQLKDNRIYFRGTLIHPTENTLFHIMGNRNIEIGSVSRISHRYFKGVVKEAKIDDLMNLLKNIISILGWGKTTIVMKGKKIVVSLKNPPHGFQKEKDNWRFQAETILGYMKLIRKDCRIENIQETARNIAITYDYS